MADDFLFLSTRAMRVIPIAQMTSAELLEVIDEGALNHEDEQMAIATSANTGGVASGTTAGPSAALTHAVTQPSAHTMSGSTDIASAGTPSGTISAPIFTGAAQNIVQPYICVYMWKRMA